MVDYVTQTSNVKVLTVIKPMLERFVWENSKTSIAIIIRNVMELFIVNSIPHGLI